MLFHTTVQDMFLNWTFVVSPDDPASKSCPLSCTPCQPYILDILNHLKILDLSHQYRKPLLLTERNHLWNPLLIFLNSEFTNHNSTRQPWDRKHKNHIRLVSLPAFQIHRTLQTGVKKLWLPRYVGIGLQNDSGNCHPVLHLHTPTYPSLSIGLKINIYPRVQEKENNCYNNFPV